MLTQANINDNIVIQNGGMGIKYILALVTCHQNYASFKSSSVSTKEESIFGLLGVNDTPEIVTNICHFPQKWRWVSQQATSCEYCCQHYQDRHMLSKTLSLMVSNIVLLIEIAKYTLNVDELKAYIHCTLSTPCCFLSERVKKVTLSYVYSTGLKKGGFFMQWKSSYCSLSYSIWLHRK